MAKLQPYARDFASPRNFGSLLAPVKSTMRHPIETERAYDHRARKILFEPYFRAWLLVGLTDDTSLRDLHHAVNHDPLYRMQGAHMEVSLQALSLANAHRPVEPFFEALGQVLAALHELPASHKIARTLDPATLGQVAELLSTTAIFDSTVLALPAKIARWAATAPECAEVKVHLRLRAGYAGLDKVILTPGRQHDARQYHSLLDLKQDAGTIYLHDCGYRDIAVYDQVVESGNHFVTRLHGRFSYEVTEELVLPDEVDARGYVLRRDCLIRLGKGKSRARHVYRLVECLDTQGNALAVLTDLLAIPASHVCLLYGYRWSVEIVIRWLKHHLQLSHLMSYSPNGLMVQVLMTMIVYGLLVLYHQSSGPLSLARLRRQIKVELHQALVDWGYEQGRLDTLAQLDKPPKELT